MIHSCTSGKKQEGFSATRRKLKALVLYGLIGHHGRLLTPPRVVRIVRYYRGSRFTYLQVRTLRYGISNGSSQSHYNLFPRTKRCKTTNTKGCFCCRSSGSTLSTSWLLYYTITAVSRDVNTDRQTVRM